MLKPSASMLTGKAAIVTGGGGGIGKGISQSFAAYGAKVLVADIDAKRASDTVAEIKKAGGQAIAMTVDARDRAQVEKMAATAFREFGHVDILVNNVGDYRHDLADATRKDFIDTEEAEWEGTYRLNLKHAMYCCKAFVPKMIERGAGGSIINMTSIEAFRGMAHRAMYTAFKAGLVQFTKSLALELSRHKIRVNDIAIDVTRSIQCNFDRFDVPEKRDMVQYWIPLGRFGDPDDIAGVAIFLASDLSRFVTGTTIHADGGTFCASGWYRTESGRWTIFPEQP